MKPIIGVIPLVDEKKESLWIRVCAEVYVRFPFVIDGCLRI